MCQESLLSVTHMCVSQQQLNLNARVKSSRTKFCKKMLRYQPGAPAFCNTHVFVSRQQRHVTYWDPCINSKILQGIALISQEPLLSATCLRVSQQQLNEPGIPAFCNTDVCHSSDLTSDAAALQETAMMSQERLLSPTHMRVCVCVSQQQLSFRRWGQVIDSKNQVCKRRQGSCKRTADVFPPEHCKSLRSDLKSSATHLYRGAKQCMKAGKEHEGEIPENGSYPASGCSWVKVHTVATILAFATKCTTSRSS